MSKETDIPVNQIIHGDWIEVAKGLSADCVHTIITSPPYWGQRNYGVDGQLGLEKTPEEHIEKLVTGFRELRRILRDDGILWLNYGDKYASKSASIHGGWDGDSYYKKGTRNRAYGEYMGPPSAVSGLKQGDLVGLAWRLALALQKDGWILRSDVIWAKAISFNDKYSGSTMPESVNGTRWERCRVKSKAWDGSKAVNKDEFGNRNTECYRSHLQAQWQDCPGCPKCELTSGLVLRQGSWRPTRAHEYLFEFVKQVPYYADMEAVREPMSYPERRYNPDTSNHKTAKLAEQGMRTTPGLHDGRTQYGNPDAGRNLRDVWTINPQPYPKAHYATFPEKLVEPCIKVSTSKKGVCPKCGGQWARIVDKPVPNKEAQTETRKHEYMNYDYGSGQKYQNWLNENPTRTLGWRPTCGCGCPETVPAVVYDPFMGSGTVAAVAARMGRNYLGSELSEDYLENQAKIRVSAAESGLSADEIESGQMAMFDKLEAGATDKDAKR